jgi:hypothetical protein
VRRARGLIHHAIAGLARRIQRSVSVWGKVRKLFKSHDVGAKPAASPNDIFAAEVEAVLRTIPSVTSFQRQPEDCSLRIRRGDKENTLFLNDIFVETREMSPESRALRIHRLLRSLEAPSNNELDSSPIRSPLRASERRSNRPHSPHSGEGGIRMHTKCGNHDEYCRFTSE